MLDAIDKKLLYLLDQDCRRSTTQLAKELRVHRNVALYRIRRLEQEGVIRGYFTELDIARLGYITLRAFIKLSNYDDEEKKSLLAAINSAPQVIWLFETQGHYDIDVVVAVKSVGEYEKFLQDIKTKHNRIIEQLRIDTLVGMLSYPKDYLIGRHRTGDAAALSASPAQAASPVQRTPSAAQPPDIDENDRKIVSALASDARKPLIELAGMTGLSVNTLKARMRQLERAGIITGYRVFIDTAKSGYTYYKLHINLRNYSAEERSGIVTFFALDNRTVYLTKYLNGDDIEAEMHLADAQALEILKEDIIARFGRMIKEFHVLVFAKEHIFRNLPADIA